MYRFFVSDRHDFSFIIFFCNTLFIIQDIASETFSFAIWTVEVIIFLCGEQLDFTVEYHQRTISRAQGGDL